MNQEQFAAACAQAIKEFYDPELDGPLLVAVRENAKYLPEDALAGEGWQKWPEYACAVGHWPEHHNGSDYAQFMLEPRDCIVDLVRHVQERWQERQPEPEEDFIRAGGDVICPDCGQPYKKHPYSYAEADLFQGHPYLNVLCNGTKVKL